MQPRQLVIMLVTLIAIVGAALFVVSWTGGDGDDTAAPTTTALTSTSSSTSTTSTTTTSTTTTTIPVECSAEPADDESDSDESTAESTTSTTTTEAADGEAGDGEGDDETDAPTTTVLNLGTNDSISTVGLGEVTFGMTVNQAQAAAGTDLVACAPASDCYRVTPANGPEGISFLVTESTIERVDIVSGPLTTRSGIGIGSPEDDIIDLFGDQIETQVNDDSSVDLIFVPQDGGDTEFRVIFTIRDGVVETFRSGRVPQVTVQDPCAN